MMRGARLMISWVLALFLAAMFLWIADLTLFPREAGRNVIFPLLVENSGFALWEPTGRYLVGLLDAIAALLMLLPLTRKAGALLALLIAIGGVAVHVLWLGLSLPVAIDSADTDGGQLFYLTIGLAAAAAILFFVHPGRAGGAGAARTGASFYSP